MWTLRLSVAGTVMLALLGGMGTAAEQSDDADASGTFGPAGSLTEARWRHTATPLADGRILVVGGQAALRMVDDEPVVPALDSAEAWDPVTESFGPAGALVEARMNHTATPLPDGHVLVVGGLTTDNRPLDSAEVWDQVAGRFDPAGSLGEARFEHTATPLPDGRVLVVGGQDAGFDRLASAEVWDPETGRFGPAGSLGDRRAGHTATLLSDGRVLVVGGARPGDPFAWLASAEVWDPATGRFGPAGTLGQGRAGHTATLLPDGRVLVVGGSGAPGPDSDRLGQFLASAEVWDPATNMFGPAGPLFEAGTGHTATPLPDGRVLVVGGRGTRMEPIASAEAWEPATASFGPVGWLSETRWIHTATPLPDGRVLVVGGVDARNDPIAMAEVWEPADGPKDMVQGTATFGLDGSRVWVRAQSDADGANASGTYHIDVADPPVSYSAEVVCLHVVGDEAVVGAVVTSTSDFTLVPIGTGLLHYVEDNGPPGAPDASITKLFEAPDSCASTQPSFPLQEVATGNWVVKDR